MSKERKIMVRAPEELHKAVRLKAVEQNRYVSEIVRELLTMWVAGEIELPAKEAKEEHVETD